MWSFVQAGDRPCAFGKRALCGPGSTSVLALADLHFVMQSCDFFSIISTLSRDQQDVISLRFLADLPYAEIAQIIGKRESAVKMIAYRALDELRRRYTHDAS